MTCFERVVDSKIRRACKVVYSLFNRCFNFGVVDEKIRGACKVAYFGVNRLFNFRVIDVKTSDFLIAWQRMGVTGFFGCLTD